MRTFREILESTIVPDVSFVRTRMEKLRRSILKRGKKIKNDEQAIEELKKAFESHRPHYVFFRKTEWPHGDTHEQRSHVANAHFYTGTSRPNITIFVTDGIHEMFKDEASWEALIDAIEDAMEHELVHLGQYERMDKHMHSVVSSKAEIDPENMTIAKMKRYLGHPHEAMAFARQEYMRMRKLGMSNEDIRNEIRKTMDATIDEIRGNKELQTFVNSYRVYFGRSEAKNDAKTFKRFMNYIYRYTL